MTQPSNRNTPRPKVFGIGFHKTGTTSLGHALELLGYRVAGACGVREEDIASTALARALELVPHFDAFQDNPWPILFRELDERFPGSRFILTTRPADSWYRSVCQHFGERETPMRRWIYGAGSPVGAEARYREVYEAHAAAVRAHFAQRPGDLLEMDLTCGDGWSSLCGFLGLQEPDVPFFHSNRAQRRRASVRKAWLARFTFARRA